MKVMLIDIDGTVTHEDIRNEDSHLYSTATPIVESIILINKWYDEGNYITFFTAREEKDREVTLKWLDDNGFKYHGLLMGKPRCLTSTDCYVWIDNRPVKAITYKGVWSDLEEKKLFCDEIKSLLMFKDEKRS